MQAFRAANEASSAYRHSEISSVISLVALSAMRATQRIVVGTESTVRPTSDGQFGSAVEIGTEPVSGNWYTKFLLWVDLHVVCEIT